jgi:DNA-binding CsgD family transcriptional regulator/tetratricopeptide (TPR) repeat protein
VVECHDRGVTGRGRTSFVGRARELDALLAAFASSTAGRTATALLGGEAGVGKSRLVDELGSQARMAGARVVVGHCLDLEEGGLPYAPFVEAARAVGRADPGDDVAAALGSLRAALGAAGGGAETAGGAAPSVQPSEATGRARVFELFVTVAERLCAQSPLVLVVEDVHWADRSTEDLIVLLSTSARDLPLLLVATYRSDEVVRRPVLPGLLSELTRRGATHLRLDRLDRGEVVALATALLGAPPSPEIAAQIADRSDGIPLFVEELASAVAYEPDAPVPPHLRDAVLARVRRLPPDAGGVLAACAVGGRQVEHDLLARVTDLDDDALATALRSCVEEQLLVADQGLGGYRFRHALLHEAVLDDVLPGERVRWHRAWADVLDDSDSTDRARAGVHAGDGDDVRAERWARLAHHRAAAGDHDGALAAAVRAGTAAERTFAVPEAHRYLEWSVRLWDQSADPEAAAGCDRGELLARAADAASRGGAIARALTLVDEALATAAVAADPVRAGLLHERRGWYLSRSGRHEDALDAHASAVELVPADPPSPARARVVQAQAHELERAGRLSDARRRAEEALAIAVSVGDAADEGQARHVLGLVLAADGLTDEAVIELNAAGEIAAKQGDLAEVAGAYVHLWRTLVEAGRGDELVDLILQLVPPGAEGGTPSLAASLAAAALHQLGRWDHAARLLGESPTDATRRPASDVHSLTGVTRTLVSGSMAVDRGDYELARDRLETARAWCHQSGDGRLNGLLHRALAELAVWEGRHDDARHEVTVGLDLLAHTGDPELAARLAAVGLRAEADLTVRTGAGASRAGAGAVADDLVSRLDGFADVANRRHAPPTCEIHAARLTGRGELGRLTGRPDPAAWQAARRTWDKLGFPLPSAYTRLRRAEALLARGGDRSDRSVQTDQTDRGEAERELRAAHAATRALGADPLRGVIEHVARRARCDLGDEASAGARTGGDARRAAGAAYVGVDSGADAFALTPREAEVLALVADGLTNRQIGERLFISSKTASVHVSRLLAKLGAATRGEAAAIAHRRGMLRDH